VLDNLIHKKELPAIIAISSTRQLRPQGRPRTARPTARTALRVRHALGSIRQVPGKRDPGRGRQEVQPAPGSQEPRHRRHQLRRHLRVHGGLGAAGPIQQGAEPRRQLHQHPRRRPLSGDHPCCRQKDIRVFLQDGSADLDNKAGNWPLANQQMASALKFKGYDYRFEYGDGGTTASTRRDPADSLRCCGATRSKPLKEQSWTTPTPCPGPLPLTRRQVLQVGAPVSSD